ncbi:MAG: hypothetical protein ACON38_10675, partial [Akkermansiaceae bacterium]
MASLRILFFFMLVGLVRAEQGMREEQLAARAGAFWKEWAHVWDGSVTDEEMSPQLSQGAVFHRDQAEVLNQRLEGAFQVNDRKVGGRAAEGRKAVLEAFRNWPLTWSEGPVERSKFKVVGVEVDEGELTTTELVAVITGGATVREYNGVWQTRWEIKGDTLLFKESNIQDGKVVSATGGTLFSERTSGLLPADCDGDLELVEENFYWRERVPASFEPDQFGENGISVADVNGDGLEDVYLCQIAGLRNRLWLRTDEGLLVEAPSSGLEIRENTCAALFLDFDAD